MVETGTFSSAVDTVVARTGRPNLQTSIESFVRATIRELQAKARSTKDLVEEEITATAAPHIWTYPSRFREVIGVKYSSIYDQQGKAVYPPRINPGNIQRDKDYFYYQSGNSLVFAGVKANDVIAIAYLLWSRPFIYYTVSERPAIYDAETESWTYLSAYDTDDTTRETARDLVTNWLLFGWFETVIEGAVAKTYKLVGDQRAVSAFALYKSYEKDLLAGEGGTRGSML